MSIKIDENELLNIKEIIERNKKNITTTHDWLKSPVGEVFKYEDLRFSKFIKTDMKDYDVLISNNQLKIVGKYYDEDTRDFYDDEFVYAEINDQVVYGEGYFDIISYSYSKINNIDALVVWRFEY